ncbi:prolipoprotein diacylglyceryl transferase [Clostridium paridis]|uniref:Phosphatidylglycerol--prolipoprotein diacylglyceryl transferase n=1 Tax=Clostridium paridis TaxID=2803863 RepID=A0A937FF64_9CLOT|nr:prolipoprotein diacylglyceryl transferase [Clostridium paridis]MBL4931780.1 prolipoprotein diacylglyceryl transferase [Clostridium paridis]
MNPVAFYVFGMDIRWYGVFISLGIVLGVILAKFNCKYREVDFDSIIDVLMVSLIIGIIGARLYYVAFEFEYYKYDLIQIFNLRQGGLAIHGGILFGGISAFAIAKYKKVNFFRIVDVVAPSIIIAQALGRWGNFFNGEAHGGVVSYEYIKHFPEFIQKGMYINGEYYQPTFLYESVWNLVVFIILMILLRKNRKQGVVFFSYLGLYSIGRFFIEGLRTDSLMLGSFRIAQLVSLGGVIIWILFLALSKYKESKE